MKNFTKLLTICFYFFTLSIPTILVAEWSVYEETSVDGTTDTVSSGTVIKTRSNHIYEVTSGYEYEYEYNPDLLVLKDGSRYQLVIEGFSKKFSANCLNCGDGSSTWKVFEETNAEGTVQMVSSGTIIKTISGNVYEVTYGLELGLEIMPEVLVLSDGLSYNLIISGFDEKFSANCLNCISGSMAVSAAQSFSSDDIKLLQWGLVSLGSPTLDIDGNYGPATKKIVATFGRKWGIGEQLSKEHFGYISIILKKEFPKNQDVIDAADRLFKIGYLGGSVAKTNSNRVVTSQGSEGCYDTSIKAPSPFMGNGGETIVLNDGTLWTESSYQYLYLYAYYPMVTVCPSKGIMLLGSDKFDITPMR